MSTAILEAQGLVKTYSKGQNQIKPLAGLDLTVKPGEFVAIMGPSGTGKSTLLHILGGLDKPDTGTCRLGEVEISAMSETKLCSFRASNVGFIFQAFNLIPILTARENVELPLRLLSLSRTRRREQVDAVLEVVGLSERADHLPAQLSGGEEQRVSIARALVSDPQVILADEPTGNLDEDTGDQIVSLLATLAKEHGKTVIMVTHDLAKARHATRILRLDHGRLTGEGQAEAPEGEA